MSRYVKMGGKVEGREKEYKYIYIRYVFNLLWVKGKKLGIICG